MTNLTNWYQVQGSRLKGYIMLISVTLCFTHWRNMEFGTIDA